MQINLKKVPEVSLSCRRAFRLLRNPLQRTSAETRGLKNRPVTEDQQEVCTLDP